jgi:hypothetical protein
MSGAGLPMTSVQRPAPGRASAEVSVTTIPSPRVPAGPARAEAVFASFAEQAELLMLQTPMVRPARTTSPDVGGVAALLASLPRYGQGLVAGT